MGMVKKTFLTFFLILLFFSLIPNSASAVNPLVFCPEISSYGLVQCGGEDQEACGFQDFFDMIKRVIQYLLYCIIPPIAILILTIGGIILIVSGGSPNLKSLGNRILFYTIIGLFIAYGSWLIIDLILKAISHPGLP